MKLKKKLECYENIETIIKITCESYSEIYDKNWLCKICDSDLTFWIYEQSHTRSR